MGDQVHIPARIRIMGARIDFPIVKSLGFDSFSKPRVLTEHVHDGYEIVYVFDGRVVWQVGSGIRLEQSGGEMAVIAPGLRHKGYLNIIQPASIFWLVTDFNKSDPSFIHQSMDISQLDGAYQAAGTMVCAGYDGIKHDLIRIHGLLCAMNATGGRKAGALAGVQIKACLSAFLAMAAGGFAAPHAPKPDSYTAAACAFMRKYQSEPLDADAIANHLGISQSRFFKVFKDHTGTTPNDYLQRLRIETACTLLVSGSRSITSIALDTGFSTSQYFAQCFRRYTGMKPVEYRRRHVRSSAA